MNESAINDRRDSYGVRHVSGKTYTSVRDDHVACGNEQLACEGVAEGDAHFRAYHDDHCYLVDPYHHDDDLRDLRARRSSEHST